MLKNGDKVMVSDKARGWYPRLAAKFTAPGEVIGRASGPWGGYNVRLPSGEVVSMRPVDVVAA